MSPIFLFSASEAALPRARFTFEFPQVMCVHHEVYEHSVPPTLFFPLARRFSRALLILRVSQVVCAKGIGVKFGRGCAEKKLGRAARARRRGHRLSCIPH